MILLRMPSGIELRLNDCEALVMEADKNRLTQILTNLLTNSIKHTEKGFIRFGYKRTAASVEFFVEDSGEGIPRDKIDSIFSQKVINIPGVCSGMCNDWRTNWDWLSVGDW